MIELGIAIAVGAIILERGINLVLVPLMHRRNGSGPASTSSIDSKISDVKLSIGGIESKLNTHCQVMDLRFDQLEHRVTTLEK